MSNIDYSAGRIIVQTAGYTRLRLPGGIFVLKLDNAQHETVEAWFLDCNKMMSRWLPDQRLRYLHDIRGAETITPYTTDCVTRILRRMRYTPIGDGRGAIVLTNKSIASLLGMFFNRRLQGKWDIRFFGDDAEALDWLSR